MEAGAERLAVRAFRAEFVPAPRGQGAEMGFPSGEGPIDLEIGCGVGLHPLRYARENPGRTLIAIEHTVERFRSFERRMARHSALPNLVAVHADAVEWVTHRVPLESIDRCFLLYPNPWPRPGDERRRWYAQPFFGRLLQSLKPESRVLLATNHRAYAERAALFFEQAWGLEVEPLRPVLGPGRTHFERKYLARGEPCFEVEASLRRPRALG
jgi:tRNA G46 methylase TrmB